MAKTPKKKATTPPAPQYSISLKLGDKTYEGTGATATEALGKLLKPAKMMIKGTVVVSDGQKKKTMLLTPVQLKRLFYNSPAIQAVKAKQLFMLMK